MVCVHGSPPWNDARRRATGLPPHTAHDLALACAVNGLRRSMGVTGQCSGKRGRGIAVVEFQA